MTPGIWQILLIVLVIVLLFGTSRLPRVMEDLAKGLNAFKKGMKDEEKQPIDDKTKNKE
jgi:sec-independent protein translocase protein TatA